MIDESMLIRQAIDTGEVVLGARMAEKSIKKKTARLVIVASNCPSYPWLRDATLKIYRFRGTSQDLGAACGRPFSVSILSVLNPGESDILSL